MSLAQCPDMLPTELPVNDELVCQELVEVVGEPAPPKGLGGSGGIGNAPGMGKFCIGLVTGPTLVRGQKGRIIMVLTA